MMSVFVIHDKDWHEYQDRAAALRAINEHPELHQDAKVVEGVYVKLEHVTQVTQYKFARGT